MQKDRFKRGRGFTLIELMVTICIVLILVTLGAPSYTTWLEQTRLKNSAQQLRLFLRQAQLIALESDQPVFVHFFTQPDCATISHLPECPCYLPVCQLQHTQGRGIFTPHIRLAQATFSGVVSTSSGSARFAGGSGLASGGAGSVLLRAGQRDIRVILSPLGRTRSCTPQAAWPGVVAC
ncbi:pilus assembly FimT family protein [Salinimonas lutimaris]|uniref:pilus assembly FimT family protein n=1 Tax=Salinimonas lutimaris TaxID=914153 RepID=UPI0015866F07|nr:prepilin-type N-terminal cleavage/methylation domain-containing protein [Salinimonas lutimaris]